jgi:LDH2 family malate/lactate/ureidoglycolate dehydrogenase
MATSTLAMGDVQIAARDGHPVPHGTGLGPDGKPSDDPKEILKGVLLPFGSSDEFLPSPRPSMSFIYVKGLFRPDIKVEIEALAAVD